MLTISQVTKAFGGRTLFEDASLQVNRGDRVGLVGPNGAGKSTLFSLILGEASPDEGKVSTERSATIGFLPQENAPAGDETVLELATAISPELSEAQRILKTTPEDSPEHHDALHAFDEHGGWQLEVKAKRILHGLAFVNRISSGARRR
jgi:ATP-binding cassette subfamily F protein 3